MSIIKTFKGPNPRIVRKPPQITPRGRPLRYELSRRRRLLLEESCVVQPSDAQVWALLHFDGTDGDTTTTDSSYYEHPMTIRGTGCRIEQDQSKFGGTSLFLDESVGQLNATFAHWPHDGTDVTSSDALTFEAWIYLNSLPSVAGDEMTIISHYLAQGNRRCMTFDVDLNNRLRINLDQTGDDTTTVAQLIADAGTELSTGQWYHVAYCRDTDGNGTLFLDGAIVGEGTGHNIGLLNAEEVPWRVGALDSTSAGNYLNRFDGYIDEVRICLDHNVYRCAFDVPTEAHADPGAWSYTETSTSDPNFSDTVFIYHAEGTDGSQTEDFSDLSGGYAYDINFLGNAQIDNAQAKFGSTSVLFDGTGDGIESTHADWASEGTELATNTYHCTELWVRFNSTAANSTLAAQYNNVTASRSWGLSVVSGALNFYTYDSAQASQLVCGHTWNPSTDTWYHVAVQKSGHEIKVFVDGTLVSSGAIGNAAYNGSATIQFGHLYSSGQANSVNGWIDEIRVTTGNRRYVNAFTAPTAAFYDGS